MSLGIILLSNKLPLGYCVKKIWLLQQNPNTMVPIYYGTCKKMSPLKEK